MSIARSVQATGKACPSLVGRHQGICDQNATRDVTSFLAKSGMSLQVRKDMLVLSLQNSDHFAV